MSVIHSQYKNASFDEILNLISSDPNLDGHPRLQPYLSSLLNIKLTEMLNRQLGATAETMAKSATGIQTEIADLTAKLEIASADLQTASAEGAKISRRLNALTGALVFVGVLTAGATTFQAWQTKRQTDVLEAQQIKSNAPPAAPKQPTEPQK